MAKSATWCVKCGRSNYGVGICPCNTSAADLRTISYTDSRTVPSVIVIWDDLHSERSGMFRAFWAASPDATTGSPVIGYCSPGGSHRTVRACAAEARRHYPGEPVYRNGKEVRP